MSNSNIEFIQILSERFTNAIIQATDRKDMVCIEIDVDQWVTVARVLRNEFHFEQLTDLCCIDFFGYGQTEWDTEQVSQEGFSRGIDEEGPGRFSWENCPNQTPEKRFSVVTHLLSIKNNQRLRMKCFAANNDMPIVPSLVDVWNAANWFEREAFDLFGVIFEGHTDLRRILTDYGFIGHPFRKDFPLVGNVDVRYDEEKGRVVYEPTTIEPRVLVPRVIRDDSRYLVDDLEKNK